jgi:hypothetical protein
MELMVEMVLDVIGGILEYTVNVGGKMVPVVVDFSIMLQVLVSAGGDPAIVKFVECGVGIQGTLDGPCNDHFVYVLVLNGMGNVVHNVAPVGLDKVLQHFVVDIDMGISGGLGDIVSQGGSSAFEGKDGKGTSVMDCTMYDLCVCKETF